MLKCLDCGHIFEDGEQKTYAEHHPYGDTTAAEYFSVCPICGGDYEETVSCESCGGEFLEDELVASYYCEECLKETADAKTFYDYASDIDAGLDSDRVNTIDHFMFSVVYRLDDTKFTYGESFCPPEFRDLLLGEYWKTDVGHKRSIAGGYDDGFYSKIFEYLKDQHILYDFAEWLHEKEVKK